MTEPGTRRGFLTGLLAAAAVPLIASPSLVRASSLMQIKGEIQPWPRSHRWLAFYDIGSDRVMLRADTLIGGPGLIGSAVVDDGFYAPPTPGTGRGLWIPSEKGQRELDRLSKPHLDALYEAASIKLDWCKQTGMVAQMYAGPGFVPDVTLRDMSMWKQRGWT